MTLAIPKNPSRIYLDHAASTPLDPRVREAMLPYLEQHFGNPSALYREGRTAKQAVDTARTEIAELLHVMPAEIIFTGSGTESDNLAVLGLARAAKISGRTHLITSAIEHHAVLRPCQALEREGFSVTYLPVDAFGQVRPRDLAAALTDHTALVSIMYTNNELGTVQPIAELARLAHARGARVHTDACQAAGALPLDPHQLGVDALTLNGSKVYGPKGTGLLYLKTGTPIHPIMFGGGQEQNLRSGTEHVAGIVGLARALSVAEASREQESKRLTALRDYCINQLRKRLPGVRLNGHPTERLPNNVHISIPHIDAEAVLGFLDEFGVSASSGSACTATSLEPSHVLLALQLPYEFIGGSMRFTLGRTTTKEQIDYLLEPLPRIVTDIRATHTKT